MRVIIKNISISGSRLVKGGERERTSHQTKKKIMMLKVLSTIQPNSSENRPGNTARWPNGLAQHEFLQTLLINGLFLFTVKDVDFMILFRILALMSQKKGLYYIMHLLN